jgi:hypothetical protein
LLHLLLMIIVTMKTIINERPQEIVSGREAAESMYDEEVPWDALASNRGFVLLSLLLLLLIGLSAEGGLLDFLSVLAMARVGQKVMV